jgi:hypothetical protein
MNGELAASSSNFTEKYHWGVMIAHTLQAENLTNDLLMSIVESS